MMVLVLAWRVFNLLSQLPALSVLFFFLLKKLQLFIWGKMVCPWHVKNLQKSVLFSHVVPEPQTRVALLVSQRLCPQSYPFGPQTTLGEPPL